MGEMELELIQALLMVVIQVVIPPLLVIGVAALKGYLERLQEHDNWYQVDLAVERAVAAAEQLELAGKLEEYGEEKFDVAVGFVEAQLAAAGVPLEVGAYADAIRAMVEAEVRRQFG